MVLTQATLAFGISMTASLLALFVAAYGAKQYSKVTFISILMFLFVIPLGMHYLYLQLEPFVLVLDWPLEVGSFLAYWSPTLAIFLASILGGLMGYFAGNYWGQGDSSCFRCQLVPFILIFLLSIVIIFLP
jgi:hypothetical protein